MSMSTIGQIHPRETHYMIFAPIVKLGIFLPPKANFILKITVSFNLFFFLVWETSKTSLKKFGSSADPKDCKIQHKTISCGEEPAILWIPTYFEFYHCSEEEAARKGTKERTGVRNEPEKALCL